jgi:hypothetical protein
MISHDEMIPVELLSLKPKMCGIPLSPRALQTQWLELNEPAAWALRWAMSVDVNIPLVLYVQIWDEMSN